MTCREWVDHYIARYERRNKRSSTDKVRASLKRFLAEIGDRPLASVERHEATVWAAQAPAAQVPVVVTLFNAAVDEELIARNPFRGLGRKTKGRAEHDPPTEEQMVLLLEACSALGDEYAPRMRALVTFAAYTIMRPGELFALDWQQVDLDAGLVQVERRLYEGEYDLPKSNKSRTIALLPQARAAVEALPERDGLVFRSKRGLRLSQPTMSGYWSQVLARARLDFDFYLASKHYGVHYMKVKLRVPNHDIAEQAGWSEAAVEEMVKTYAHISMGALDRIKAAAGDKHDADRDADPARSRS
jgi:integrase